MAPDDSRNPFHEMWAGVAPRWDDHADEVDVRGAPVTEHMLAAAQLAPGQHVLELACGPGGVGLAAAERVAPGGEVLLSDVVPEMTAIAARRATDRDLRNVTTALLDLDGIDRPDASHDVVLCRDGLMFAGDHARAAGEIARVLRPGGRVVAAVWGPRDRNPWLALMLDGLSARLGMPVPPPGVHGPFALADDGQLAGLLAGAGFVDVEVAEVDQPLLSDSFDDWFARTAALAGPVAQILAGLPDDVKADLSDDLRTAIAPYATREGDGSGALELPGVNLVATARRPA